MNKLSKQEELTEEEMDEIAISQADDDDAWGEEITVTPVARARAARIEDAHRRSER
jgi:hypothetical protein